MTNLLRALCFCSNPPTKCQSGRTVLQGAEMPTPGIATRTRLFELLAVAILIVAWPAVLRAQDLPERPWPNSTPPTCNSGAPFSDVPVTNWACGYIQHRFSRAVSIVQIEGAS